VALSAAGPHACPFVALSDDRDARSASPDQAHRCYAEERPEPRTLSHQRTYCLTREYAVCPHFLEWADRLAARKVGPALEPFIGYEATAAAPGSQLALPAAAGSSSGIARAYAAEAELGVATGRRPGGPLTTLAAGTATAPTFLDAEEVEEIDEAGRLIGRARRPVGPGTVRGAIALPLLDRVRRRDRGAGAGLAVAGTDGDAGDAGDALGQEGGRTIVERARIFGDRARNFGGRITGPDWEPRRISDDYPRLRVPAALPPIPPLALAAAALLIAALAILVVPGLLGTGGQPEPSTRPGGLPAVSPTLGPGPSATPSPSPTERPKRRFRNYTVKPGDTLFSIADHFGVTVRQIRNANPRITNPDRIKVGDRIRIPLGGGGPARSPSPTPSPSG
jgi:hypothetical protein